MERDENENEPFVNHVYIGFSPKDKNSVLDLRRQLENEGVMCYPRDTIGIQSSIDEGVRTSKKCLLFLSPDYLQDEWRNMETAAVLKKVELFGNNTLIIMKSESSQEVPEKLRGYTEFVFRSKEDAVARMATVLTKEPTMILKYGPAAGYFHGYLNIILPGFRQRLTDAVPPEWRKNTVKKMLIILPESCFCPASMNIQAKIEFTDKFVIFAGNRAGNQRRDYSNSVYRVKEGDEEYYFAGEFTTPLVTLYEAFKARYCNMTDKDLYAERDFFYYMLKAILDHPDNARCKDQFKLVYWSDSKTEKKNRLDLHQFLLSVIKKELDVERLNEASKIQSSDVNFQASEGQQEPTSEPTFEPTLFEPIGIEKYPMDHSPRGKCLIINIIHFTNGNFNERTGSEKDTETLKKLFSDLHFDFEIHTDVDYETLEKLLITTSNIDHSRYDAFVCCILSHGKLGAIYTSDGEPVDILSIVDFFGDIQCPSLKGKPKMFFIQACQSDINRLANDFATGCAVGEENRVAELVESDAHRGIASSEKVHNLVPSYPDFLMSYSTLPGALSYRDTSLGSFYINALNKHLRNGDEIDRALKQVTKMVREELNQRGTLVRGYYQLPFHLTCAMERFIVL